MEGISQPAAKADPSPPACDRCGNFAPLTYKFGPGLCATCLEVTVHPVQKSAVSLGSLLSGVWMMLRQVGLPASIILLVANVPLTVLTTLWPAKPWVLDSVYDLFVTMPCQMVVAHIAYQVIYRRGAWTLRDATRTVGRRYGALLVTNIVEGFGLFFYALLLIVPAVVMAMSWIVASPIALLESRSGQEALSESARRVKGHRWAIFGAACALVAPMLVFVVVAACAGGLTAFAQGPTHGGDTLAMQIVLHSVGFILPLTLVPFNLLPIVIYAKVSR